jgi:hypothetical protein
MLKKISATVLAGMLAMPLAATAGGSETTLEALEQQVYELQKAIADLKAKDAQKSQEIADLKAKGPAPAPAGTEVQSLQKAVTDLEAKDAQKSKEIADLKAMGPAAAAPSWTDKVTLGGRARLRGYKIDNVWDFSDAGTSDKWSVFRLYTSLWANVKASDTISGRIQISNQNWGEIGLTGENVDNKLFVENAYVTASSLFNLPLTATFGRQNAMYGSGFVLFDGQSQTGSTSIYFDGVKLRWDIADKFMLDGLYLKDNEGNRDDNSDDDITLRGFYFTNTEDPFIGAKQELYALNRDDQGLSKSVCAYGYRISDKIDMGIDYSGEITIQRGDFSDTVDQDALGYKLDAGYTFKDVAIKPRIYLGYAFMSGDDPSTSDNERWDVMYGGWPQWGDLLAFKFLNVGPLNIISSYDPTYNDHSSTGGEAVYSNIKIATIGGQAKLIEKLSVDLSYSLLTIDETTMDDNFGNYYQATLKYQYAPPLSFSLYAAMIDPGDAFTSPNTDKAYEVFWEVDFRF